MAPVHHGQSTKHKTQNPRNSAECPRSSRRLSNQSFDSQSVRLKVQETWSLEQGINSFKMRSSQSQSSPARASPRHGTAGASVHRLTWMPRSLLGETIGLGFGALSFTVGVIVQFPLSL